MSTFLKTQCVPLIGVDRIIEKSKAIGNFLKANILKFYF